MSDFTVNNIAVALWVIPLLLGILVKLHDIANELKRHNDREDKR